MEIPLQYSLYSDVSVPKIVHYDWLDQMGEFHISHDASLHTILPSFRTHVILSVLMSSTGTRQLNNGGKRLVLPLKPSVPLLCRSIYDFRSTIPNISLVKSRRMFGCRLVVNYCN